MAGDDKPIGLQASCYFLYVQILILRFWGVCYDFLFRIFRSTIWINVGSFMYMSDEATFIVWIDLDWNADSVPLLGRHNPLNARFGN